VVSIIEPMNVASIRVAEKVGMTLETNTHFYGIPVRLYSIDATQAIEPHQT
jgi:RimJ/RimL family protein N-acetyltransferase